MSKETESTVVFMHDGMDYPLNITDLTANEVGIIKRVGHIRGVTDLSEALIGGDMEVVVALLGIAMTRAGAPPDYDKLLNLPIGEIEVKEPENPTIGEATPEESGLQPSVESTE